MSLNMTLDNRSVDDEEIKIKNRNAKNDAKRLKEKRLLMKKACACGRKIIVRRKDFEQTNSKVECGTCKTIGYKNSLAEFERLKMSGRKR